MTRRTEQAYNDGRLNYRAGMDTTACSRRNPEQRAAWMRGYEHERRLDLAAQITPERREEADRTVANLKAWAKENLK